MTKQNNTAFWIIGIIVFLLVVANYQKTSEEDFTTFKIRYYDQNKNEIFPYGDSQDAQPQIFVDFSVIGSSHTKDIPTGSTSTRDLISTDLEELPMDIEKESYDDLNFVENLISRIKSLISQIGTFGISQDLSTYVAEASTGYITIPGSEIHHARWVEAKKADSTYVWGSDWAATDDNELDNIGVNVVTTGVEVRRGYISWYLNTLGSIPSGAVVTGVTLHYYVHSIKDTYGASDCDDLEFWLLKESDSDISDWTPDTSTEAAAIWYKIEDRTRYGKDISVDENMWNSINLGSTAASRMQSDRISGYDFYVGFMHDEDDAGSSFWQSSPALYGSDCYMDIDAEGSAYEPYLRVQYTCTLYSTYKCYNNDVYWYDSCGVRGTKKTECGTSGYTGVNYCYNGDVYRDYVSRGCSGSSCTTSTSRILQETCGIGYTCGTGACVADVVEPTYIQLDIFGNNLGDVPFTNMQIINAEPSLFLTALQSGTVHSTNLSVGEANKLLFTSDFMEVSQLELLPQPVNFWVNISGLSEYAELTKQAEFPWGSTPSSPPVSTLTDGLVAYYKLDGTSGIIDELGGYDGINYGATPNVAGKINTAYSFDGSNDYVGFTSNDFFKPTNDFSISTWLKTTSINGVIFSSSKQLGSPTYRVYGILLFVDANGKVSFQVGNPVGYVSMLSTQTVNNGIWHHIVVSASGGTAKLYIDGVLTDTKVINPEYLAGNYIYLGCRNDVLVTRISYFNGVIDEFGLWNKGINIDEISQLYGGESSYPF